MKEKKVLREIIRNIFGLDTEKYEIVDMALDKYTDKVFLGETKDKESYIIGTFEDTIVSIEKEGLMELYDVIDVMLS